MPKLRHEVIITINKKSIRETATFDTTLFNTFLKKSFAEKIGARLTGFRLEAEVLFEKRAKTKEALIDSIEIDGLKRTMPTVFITDNLPSKIIIGNKLMQELGLRFLPAGGKFVLEKSEPWVVRV